MLASLYSQLCSYYTHFPTPMQVKMKIQDLCDFQLALALFRFVDGTDHAGAVAVSDGDKIPFVDQLGNQSNDKIRRFPCAAAILAVVRFTFDATVHAML